MLMKDSHHSEMGALNTLKAYKYYRYYHRRLMRVKEKLCVTLDREMVEEFRKKKDSDGVPISVQIEKKLKENDSDARD